jgi:iron(III) transport system substrate-binding protein
MASLPRTLKSVFLAAAAIGCLVTLSACGDTATDAGADGSKGVLNVYSARHYDADEALYAGFEAKTGIKVRRIENKAEQLIERMAAEGEASPADVVLLVDAGNYWRADQRGLLQPIESPVLEAAIPAYLRDENGKWFGIARRARVIAYDKATVQPGQVATYAQLADPALKGKVCIRSSSNIYNLSMMAGLIETIGTDDSLAWARGVVANFARPPEGGDTDQLDAIAQGKCSVALVNHYYYLRYARSTVAAEKATADKIALSFPDQEGAGTHVNISGAAVAAHAPNRAAAVAFLEYLVSPEAQKILSEANNEFPVVAGTAPANPELVAVADFKESQIPLNSLGRFQADAQRLFDTAGWR